MGLQWHQLDHRQIICTLLQTSNHASTSPLSFYRPDALPAANKQHQSTEGIVYNLRRNLAHVEMAQWTGDHEGDDSDDDDDEYGQLFAGLTCTSACQ